MRPDWAGRRGLLSEATEVLQGRRVEGRTVLALGRPWPQGALVTKTQTLLEDAVPLPCQH